MVQRGAWLKVEFPMIDLAYASVENFADMIHRAVHYGYEDAKNNAPLATPSQILALLECTGGEDHARAVFAAYEAGRRHHAMGLDKPEVRRMPEPNGGRPAQQHAVSPKRHRPEPHVEFFPRGGPASGRPSMSVPLNPSLPKTAPQTIGNVKRPWR
jgi:hypothetical protein